MDYNKKILNNLLAFLSELSECNNCRFVKNDAYSFIVATDSSWPSFVFNVKPDRNKPDVVFETLSNDKEAPDLIIITEEQVSEYEKQLAEYSFLPVAEYPCLAIDTNDVTNHCQDSNLSISQVTNEAALRKWVDIAGHGFGELDISLFIDLLPDKRFGFYIGSYNSEAVSSAMIYLDEDIAGIYHVVTLPEFRDKGLGSGIFKHCQLQAKAKGAKLIIAQSTKESVNAWERTGMSRYGNFYLFCRYKS